MGDLSKILVSPIQYHDILEAFDITKGYYMLCILSNFDIDDSTFLYFNTIDEMQEYLINNLYGPDYNVFYLDLLIELDSQVVMDYYGVHTR